MGKWNCSIPPGGAHDSLVLLMLTDTLNQSSWYALIRQSERDHCSAPRADSSHLKTAFLCASCPIVSCDGQIQAYPDSFAHWSLPFFSLLTPVSVSLHPQRLAWIVHLHYSRLMSLQTNTKPVVTDKALLIICERRECIFKCVKV